MEQGIINHGDGKEGQGGFFQSQPKEGFANKGSLPNWLSQGIAGQGNCVCRGQGLSPGWSQNQW